tara:strand:+ start:1017 stop:1427 length:411 start_codon:yes stop_codon:yes gene_type:complete
MNKIYAKSETMKIYHLVNKKIEDANIPKNSDRYYVEIVLDEDVFKKGLHAFDKGYIAIVRKFYHDLSCELWSLETTEQFSSGIPLEKSSVFAQKPNDAVLEALSFELESVAELFPEFDQDGFERFPKALRRPTATS